MLCPGCFKCRLKHREHHVNCKRMCLSLSNKNRVKASCIEQRKKEKKFCKKDNSHKSCALFTHRKKKCAKGLIKRLELYMVRYCRFECSDCNEKMERDLDNQEITGGHLCNRRCKLRCKTKRTFNLKYFQRRIHKINKGLGLSRFEKLDELRQVDVIKLKNDIKKLKEDRDQRLNLQSNVIKRLNM